MGLSYNFENICLNQFLYLKVSEVLVRRVNPILFDQVLQSKEEGSSGSETFAEFFCFHQHQHNSWNKTQTIEMSKKSGIPGGVQANHPSCTVHHPACRVYRLSKMGSQT